MKRFALVLACAAAPACSGTPQQPPLFQPNCTASEPSADAKVTAGHQQDGSVIIPGGRRLTPAGTLFDLGGFPLAIRMLPGDRYAVVTDGDYGDEALRIVDLQATDPHNAIVAKQDYLRSSDDPHAPALFYGMALTADGKRLYVSDGGYDPVPDSMPLASHYNPIDVYDIAGDPPQLTRNDALQIHLPFNAGSSPLPSGILLSQDEQTLWVVGQNDSTLRAIDLTPGASFGSEAGRAALDGVNPYDVAIDDASHTAFVSLWGGRRNGPDQYTDGLVLVDVTDRTMPMAMSQLLPVGKLAEAELLLGGKLYVTSADADELSVIDVATKAVTTASVALGSLIGASPNNLAIDQTGGRIYLADANENAVRVLDLQTLADKGAIPTAWYPTAVAVRADGSLVIASGKGLGMGATDHAPGRDDYMQGTLQLVPKPSDADLTTGAQTAQANLSRPKSYQVQLTCPSDGEKRFPLPPDETSPTPIQHVFLIVRENKTYDVELGDQPGANGKADLALFGGDNTPNLHALASTFSNLDNFYANAEQSLQGHEWTTAAFSNDYSEKGWATTWGRAYRPVGAFGSGLYEHLPLPPTDTAWTHLDKANVTYHNYGEVVNTQGAVHLFDNSYPGVIFDLNEKDIVKAQFVIDNLNDPTFPLERFSYIGLPNDHTYGTSPGKPTPQSMVADNDEATGMLVDAISHSQYWSSSAIFLVEDDPSDGGDHVEGHRSPCLVMSPWVKRGYVSSVHYDDPALWATINLLLGVKPMNGFDGNAAAMYDVFATAPDLTPYTYIPRKIPEAMNSSDAPFAEQSAAIDWSRPDSAPLGRILWNAIKGQEPPWGAKDSPRGNAGQFRDDDDD